MNFYQHHIGDYASLTGHLTPMQDIAYRRALERYYKTEAPLPLDTDRVARLLRLAEYPDAVEAVLLEFFTETPEGWRNQRADEEIERMQEKQEVVEERDQHEKTRMQRHREKRAAMFAVLADVGVYPAFNAKTSELEAAMRDAGVTLPVTAASPAVTVGVTSASPTAEKTGEKQPLGDAPVTPDVTPRVTPPTEGSDGTGYGTGDAGDEPATASRARIPNTRTITITNKQKKEAQAPFALPDWVPADAWQGYVEMRQKIRKPMTDRARDLRIADLSKFMQAGHDLAAILDKSTSNNWTDLYEPKPAQRFASVSTEPDWRREQRERMQQAAPYAVARPARRPFNPDDEATDVLPLS